MTPVPTSQRFVAAGDLQLWTESFGAPEYPAVLLIMGAWNQGIIWPDEFCAEIAGHGYYVIRYDHRDTGQSSVVDFKAKPYDLDALTQDAVHVLNVYGVGKAHVVGLSMGGFIGQLLALDYADRVLTLTLIMSSPDQRVTIAALLGQPIDGYRLSPPSPQVLAHFARMRQSPPKSPEEVLRNAVESWRVVNGNGVAFDETWTSALVQRAAARTESPSAAANHSLAMAASPARTDRLSQILVPTLVIHGELDPLLPLDHGAALAEAIPEAKLVIVPNMGHMLSRAACPRVAAAILEHLARNGK